MPWNWSVHRKEKFSGETDLYLRVIPTSLRNEQTRLYIQSRAIIALKSGDIGLTENTPLLSGLKQLTTSTGSSASDSDDILQCSKKKRNILWTYLKTGCIFCLVMIVVVLSYSSQSLKKNGFRLPLKKVIAIATSLMGKTSRFCENANEISSGSEMLQWKLVINHSLEMDESTNMLEQTFGDLSNLSVEDFSKCV
ncbi:hypothetical protein ScPMuIL_010539 [Solemya velum]